MEQATSSLSKEIEAMAAIGRALGELSDPAAVQRVLRWAIERYALASVAQPATQPASQSAPQSTAAVAVADPDLAVDNLTDMFSSAPAPAEEDLSEFAAPASQRVLAGPKPSVETVLKSFAADFQRFADEWNGAAA